MVLHACKVVPLQIAVLRVRRVPPERAAQNTLHQTHSFVEVVAPWPCISAAGFAFSPGPLTPAGAYRFSGFVPMLVVHRCRLVLSCSGFCACSRRGILKFCFLASSLYISQRALSRLCIVRATMRVSYVLATLCWAPGVFVWTKDNLLRRP